MRITTFTDFSLRTLIYLASLPPDQMSSVQQVSRVYNVSQNHMVKVVGKLKKLGYIHAQRGKGGGISIAQAPEDINIGRVIAQMENHMDGVDCNAPACQLAPCCELRKALMVGMQAFIAAMENYTLADIMTNKEQFSPLLFINQPEGLDQEMTGLEDNQNVATNKNLD
ncbi:Rrf2 family transcriptional regulator [Oceanospirillum beijerinckii]|uniref:Rrf2 family transcriptional regulator n=1 Tax=Oceanospirillum beijerinckii TaxID=64976 RepID=UPI000408FFD0|nr:Rrf2 family transcriptional regulator [Oceanospirillum beijerinckii]MAC45797.1 transcriptional repressor NsrR [Oceanospirillum sp.]